MRDVLVGAGLLAIVLCLWLLWTKKRDRTRSVEEENWAIGVIAASLFGTAIFNAAMKDGFNLAWLIYGAIGIAIWLGSIHLWNLGRRKRRNRPRSTPLP